MAYFCLNRRFSSTQIQKAIRRKPSNANKTVLLVLLVLLSTASAAVFVNPVAAAETTYIRADGSVDPPTAPIHVDGNVYTLTGNISGSIVVQTDNIVIDGGSYTLQGPGGMSGTTAITLTGRSGIAIKNMKVTNFYIGIVLSGSSNNTIYGNEITGITTSAIRLYISSNYNTISGNNLHNAITLTNCSSNTISGNTITTSLVSITLSYSSSNTIFRNNVTSSLYYGIILESSNYNSFYENNILGSNAYDEFSLEDSNYNSFYRNNILGNGAHSLNSTNVWYGDYPSIGNFWSDYNGTDSNDDGIGDTPYVIDAANQDQYPLMSTFQEEYSLTVNVVGSGSVIKIPNQATYGYGVVVTLTATPAPGWSFSGWSSALSSSINPEKIIMIDNKLVTATFQILNTPPYQPQLSINPNLAVKDNDDLVATIVGPTPPDPNDDSVTYSYRWFVDVGTGSFVDDEGAGRGDHTGNTVPAAHTTVGDIWRVEVKPTDEHGNSGPLVTVDWQIVVDDAKPVANAGPNQTVNEDTRITFDGSASTDNVGITNYIWVFTDATPQTLMGKNPSYVFATPGMYTVTLNVTDAAENWATATVVITVSRVTPTDGTGQQTTEPSTKIDATKPIANAGSDKLAVEGKVVTFDAGNSSDNVGITNYAWAFGDGTTGTGRTTAHMYNESGTYTITLTVNDLAGNTQTDSMTITIQKDTDRDDNPDVTDTDDDNDGMPDTWEIDNGLDPLEANDVTLDSDQDGLTSIQEYLLKTNPNVPNGETQPQSLYVVAVGIGAIAAITMAILVNLGGLGKSFDSTISKLPIPEKIKEFLQLYGEKLFETVDKAKLDTLEKAPFIARGEIVAFVVSALMAMIVFGSAEASGLQNFLTYSGLISSLPSALISACVVILVGELFEAAIARTCKIYRQFKLWMYGAIVFLISGLLFQLPFGSPGTTRYQSGEISKKTKGLLVLSKMLLLLALAIPFAGLLLLGFDYVGTIGLKLTLMTVCFSLLPLRPLVGKAVFDYRKEISLIALLGAGILFFSCASNLLPAAVYLAAGVVSAILAGIALYRMRNVNA